MISVIYIRHKRISIEVSTHWDVVKHWYRHFIGSVFLTKWAANLDHWFDNENTLFFDALVLRVGIGVGKGFSVILSSHLFC